MTQQNKHKKHRKTKNYFSKRNYRNADLQKPVLNKIMNTQE